MHTSGIAVVSKVVFEHTITRETIAFLLSGFVIPIRDGTAGADSVSSCTQHRTQKWRENHDEMVGKWYMEMAGNGGKY